MFVCKKKCFQYSQRIRSCSLSSKTCELAKYNYPYSLQGYFEDTHLQMHITHRQHLQVVYSPELSATHIEHGTFGSDKAKQVYVPHKGYYGFTITDSTCRWWIHLGRLFIISGIPNCWRCILRGRPATPVTVHCPPIYSRRMYEVSTRQKLLLWLMLWFCRWSMQCCVSYRYMSYAVISM